MSSDRIWLVWEAHRRSQELSRAFSATLFEIGTRRRGVARYLLNSFATIAVLLRERPRILFVQNPSIALALIAIVWGRLSRQRVIVDSHNAGIRPFEGRSRVANALARTIARNADLNLVTNDSVCALVESWGGRASVMIDKLPTLSGARPRAAEPKRPPLCLCIVTWKADEPIEALFAAAAMTIGEASYSFTGRPDHRRVPARGVPPNVRLCGYLERVAFDQLLSDADIVIDLTTRSDCLVCGAYEALAAGRPLVVSDWPVLRGLLGEAAVYCRNEPEPIAAAVRAALTEIPKLERAASRQAALVDRCWRAQKAEVDVQLAAVR